VHINDAELRHILERTRRIAVLGIKPESHAQKPAHFVPRYLADAGYEIVPVPVYYPDVGEILGRPVYRRLADVPGRIDLVDVFRRSEDIPPHLPDIMTAHPAVVWFQSGIRNDPAAAMLTRAGITVVQDRCLMVDHQALLGGAGGKNDE
jgi:predicted CoA-binding protein